MSLSIYKKLGFGVPKPTTIRLMMANRLVKHPLGVLCDVLIILGRLYFSTGRALVDVKRGELKFRMNKDEVKINICRSMKQTNDISMVLAIEVVSDENMRVLIKERMAVETLVVVLINFDANFQCDYVETVNSLKGMVLILMLSRNWT